MTTNTVKHTPTDTREWQDISTAPKDGAEFSPRFGPAILLATTYGSRAIGYWDENGEGISGQRGWICIQTHRPLYKQKWSHWMPLPPAPQEKG